MKTNAAGILVQSNAVEVLDLGSGRRSKKRQRTERRSGGQKQKSIDTVIRVGGSSPNKWKKAESPHNIILIGKKRVKRVRGGSKKKHPEGKKRVGRPRCARKSKGSGADASS